MLLCKRLDKDAILPTVTHVGEDLGYDLYSIEYARLEPNSVVKIRTGVSAKFVEEPQNIKEFGLLYRDRSSLAFQGITVVGGVIDSGYCGELIVMLINLSSVTRHINAGDKIVQMIPTPIYAETSSWVDELPSSARDKKGFGSSGR
jgi:dUTP pyrophosphatase